MGDSVYQVVRNLDITEEVVEKLKGRKEKLERRKTRHQQEIFHAPQPCQHVL